MSATLPRITARVDFDTQDLLLQAAAASGISSINSFVLSAAIEKAKKILRYEKTLKLSKNDAIALIDAIDSKPRVKPRLQQAAQNYKSKEQL
jgi:uncharacterized protein (DUF1778 family)